MNNFKSHDFCRVPKNQLYKPTNDWLLIRCIYFILAWPVWKVKRHSRVEESRVDRCFSIFKFTYIKRKVMKQVIIKNLLNMLSCCLIGFWTVSTIVQGLLYVNDNTISNIIRLYHCPRQIVHWKIILLYKKNIITANEIISYFVLVTIFHFMYFVHGKKLLFAQKMWMAVSFPHHCSIFFFYKIVQYDDKICKISCRPCC